MMGLDKFYNIEPYALNKIDKGILLTERLKELSLFHYNNCKEYRNIIDTYGINLKEIKNITDVPFLPVRVFKEFELKSIDNIAKTMTSSGTTGQKVSKIFVDSVTASNQQKTMVKIVSDFIGNKRLPMIVLDTDAVLKDRSMFSARGAGILGFSMFASKRIYAFDKDMNLNKQLILDFINEHKNENILLFGFTFMIWQYFYKVLLNDLNFKIDLSNAMLIHGGGWKKLINESVSKDNFKKELNKVCNIKINNIHDYYGMVEQTGCIYMECECGHLHTSNFSDVIIRNYDDFSVCENGEEGIIQVVSSIPESYPGHSILTEDKGIILGEDDCHCGRKGKYFEIIGRIKDAEIRGCSDTYERK